MAKVKTAVSIQRELFQEIDSLAHKIHISRSRLFEKAVEDFLERQKSQRIFQQLDAAYNDAPDKKEKRWRREAKISHLKIMEEEW